jgi:hypothetical protein
MKRKAFLLGMTICGACCGWAQTSTAMPTINFDPTPTASQKVAAPEQLTATTAFINAPVAIFPTIDKMTRLDMLDYFNSGSTKPSKNLFSGECRIESVSEEQLTVATSEASKAEMTLLKSGNDTIIMVITTLKTPVNDSSIKFYTSAWKELKNSLFAEPKLDGWMLAEGKARKADLENVVPFILAEYSYDPSSSTLTLTNNLDSYLPTDDSSWVMPLLAKTLTYRWNGKKMVTAKN